MTAIHPLAAPTISRQTAPVISVSPLELNVPGRGTPLQVRVSAPTTGAELPILVFAHGFGASLDDYAPLVQHWAARGFAVFQPTFLDSRTLNLSPEDPRTPQTWRWRVTDLQQVLDHLDTLAAAIPGLPERLDRTRISAVGHSYGAQTVGMLLGARIFDADGSTGEDLRDPRIQAGVLLTPAGRGGADLTPFAAEHFPFMHPSFAELTTPALVVAGDEDYSPLSVRGPDWFTDAYTDSPGAQALLTLFGGEHLLGGIVGSHSAETTDENPARVAAVQEISFGWLRSQLYPGDPAWAAARAWLEHQPEPQGRIDTK